MQRFFGVVSFWLFIKAHKALLSRNDDQYGRGLRQERGLIWSLAVLKTAGIPSKLSHYNITFPGQVIRCSMWTFSAVPCRWNMIKNVWPACSSIKNQLGKLAKLFTGTFPMSRRKTPKQKRTFEDLKNITSIVAPGRTLEWHHKLRPWLWFLAFGEKQFRSLKRGFDNATPSLGTSMMFPDIIVLTAVATQVTEVQLHSPLWETATQQTEKFSRRVHHGNTASSALRVVIEAMVKLLQTQEEPLIRCLFWFSTEVTWEGRRYHLLRYISGKHKPATSLCMHSKYSNIDSI